MNVVVCTNLARLSHSNDRSAAAAVIIIYQLLLFLLAACLQLPASGLMLVHAYDDEEDGCDGGEYESYAARR